MPDDLFDDMKRFVDFDETDARALAELKAPLLPVLPHIVTTFYDTLTRHPRARAVFAGGEEQIERLRRSFRKWLEELFSGPYDDAYFERRCNIGRVHVRVNLPQYFMFTAMNVVRLALLGEIQTLGLPETAKKLVALEKILDLELAIMNQTYREDLVHRMQALEHAQYEKRLSETKHLATVGELAASLAHEIKNPLAGISGAIQIIGASLAADHPHKEIIVESLRQIDRLDAAVKDLLVYARPKPPSRTDVNLNELVERAMIILREEPSFQGVQFRCEGMTKTHRVCADETQLQQVLTNLLINAAHACDEHAEIVCHILSIDSGVQITVEDNGIGMEPEVVARASEPFFTTKAKGTGLGLSICKRIVESHGGKLVIDSEPGKGTRIIVEIPDP